MSGHSKWNTIKRKKGAADAKRGKIFTKLIKEITLAARLGGPEHEGNARLRQAVMAAKEENMPRDNIDRAIKKGSGGADGSTSYEEVVYEGYGPGGAAILVEAMTDNKNRTVAEIRHIFQNMAGTLVIIDVCPGFLKRRGASYWIKRVSAKTPSWKSPLMQAPKMSEKRKTNSK